MKKIEDRNEIKEDEFLSLIEQINQALQWDGKATEIGVVDAIVDILAFKYWQENVSAEANASLESPDYSYVQRNWNLSCEFQIGEDIGCCEPDRRVEGLCKIEPSKSRFM